MIKYDLTGLISFAPENFVIRCVPYFTSVLCIQQTNESYPEILIRVTPPHQQPTTHCKTRGDVPSSKSKWTTSPKSAVQAPSGSLGLEGCG